MTTPGPRFRAALVLAAEVHADQRRKGTEIPYVAHVLAVTAIVLEHGGDEDEAIAALLHDAVEDGGGRPMLERIRNEFGERVAMIVDGCTDAYVDPKPPWAERKRAYLAELVTADDAVVLVSAADKLHNATAILNDHRAVGDAVWGRFKATPEETVGYYVALADDLPAPPAGHEPRGGGRARGRRPDPRIGSSPRPPRSAGRRDPPRPERRSRPSATRSAGSSRKRSAEASAPRRRTSMPGDRQGAVAVGGAFVAGAPDRPCWSRRGDPSPSAATTSTNGRR